VRVRVVGPRDRDDAGPSRAIEERPTRGARGKEKAKGVRVESDTLGEDESRALRRRELAEAIARQRVEVEVAAAKLEALERIYNEL
jgi:hypothetical protein